MMLSMLLPTCKQLGAEILGLNSVTFAIFSALKLSTELEFLNLLCCNSETFAILAGALKLSTELLTLLIHFKFIVLVTELSCQALPSPLAVRFLQLFSACVNNAPCFAQNEQK